LTGNSTCDPRSYAERFSAEEPAFILFPASEDVETFEILTCRAVAIENDAGGVCEFVLRPLFSSRPSEAGK
jgi:hypothetical protein